MKEIRRELVNNKCEFIGYYYIDSEAERILTDNAGNTVDYASLSIGNKNTVDKLMDAFESDYNRIEDGYEIYSAKGFTIRRKILRAEIVSELTFHNVKALSGMTNSKLAKYFDIPERTVEHWSAGDRECPQYLLKLMEYKLTNENK